MYDYDSLLQLPYGISKRLNFPSQSLQQASKQLVGVTSHMQFTFWNKSTSNDTQFGPIHEAGLIFWLTRKTLIKCSSYFQNVGKCDDACGNL